MKKFYQNSDAFTCVTIRDRKRLSDIFSEYGFFIFHTNRYGDGSAYEETIVCTSFAENLDPAFDSFDFFSGDDSETRVSLLGSFDQADLFFHKKGRVACCFVKIKGLEEIKILLDNGPVVLPDFGY